MRNGYCARRDEKKDLEVVQLQRFAKGLAITGRQFLSGQAAANTLPDRMVFLVSNWAVGDVRADIHEGATAGH